MADARTGWTARVERGSLSQSTAVNTISRKAAPALVQEHEGPPDRRGPNLKRNTGFEPATFALRGRPSGSSRWKQPRRARVRGRSTFSSSTSLSRVSIATDHLRRGFCLVQVEE